MLRRGLRRHSHSVCCSTSLHIRGTRSSMPLCKRHRRNRHATPSCRVIVSVPSGGVQELLLEAISRQSVLRDCAFGVYDGEAQPENANSCTCHTRCRMARVPVALFALSGAAAYSRIAAASDACD